ncbi:MAG: thiolase domain-containing protein [Candidatus Hodarchaeales archaeon]|jgi:acetyl-CoA C-acetyltransferase
MEDVALIGVAQTKFGEHWETGLRDLASEVGYSILESVEKGISPNDVQGVIVSNAGSAILNGQSNIAALVTDQVGVNGKPAFCVEAGGASGGLAIATAYMAIRSGIWDTCLVVGLEKMTDQTRSAAIVSLQSSGLDAEWEALQGQTEAGAYALIAQAYFNAYNANNNHLASVGAKNHANAVYNKYAQFRRAFTIEQIVRANMVAEPLTLLDCSPASDGAVAALLTKASLAKTFTDTPVYVKGIGQATDTLALHDRPTLTSFKATKEAASQAYKMADLKPKDIQIAELYDNYSITEILALEDLGFFEPGQGAIASLENKTAIGSEIVATNTSGGLKAMGHPIGATGVAQAAEIFWQLRNEDIPKERQTNAEIGLSHCVGGIGSTVSINIFSK